MSGNNNFSIIKAEGATAMVTLNKVSQAADGAMSAFQKLSGSISKTGESAIAFKNINQGLQNFSNKLGNAILPGVALNSSLARLSAVTGVTGKGLKEIEGYARDAAKTFGGSAADSVESYKLVLSQLSPEIAKVPEALAQMGAHIKTTSKTMGGDTQAAAEVLTTAMNQFQVSLADPMQAAGEMGKMMNIMAAAAKKGSAELPQIKAALEQSGMAAKMAGVSFAETNAAIQVLDEAGKKGSEGGVALRNVMATLAQGQFLPKDVQEELTAAGVNVNSLADKTLSLSERLKPLQAVMADDALMTKLFSKENSKAAMALLSGLDAMDGYTAAIQGTTTATDQAGVIMGSFAEKMARQKAWVDDLKITLFNFTGELMPCVKGVATFFQATASVMTGVNAIACISESAWMLAIKARTKALFSGTKAMIASVGSMGFYNAMTLASVATTYAFSFAIKAVSKAIYAIPIIGWIAAGISLVITVFKILWDKCEGFRRILFATFEVVKAVFYNIGIVIKSLWENIVKPYIMFWWDLAKTVAGGIWSAMQWCRDGIITGFTAVGNFFTGLWDSIMSGVSAVSEFLTGIWDWLAETCGGLATFISDIFSAIATPITEAFAPVWDFVSGIFTKITETVSKFFGWISKMWNKLFPKDAFKDLGEAAEKGLASGSESYRNSQAPGGESRSATGGIQNNEAILGIGANPAAITNNLIAKTTGNRTVPGSNAGKNDKSDTLDLNSIVQQTKGSTAYSAIASRLSGVKMPSMAKMAATVALPLTVASTASGEPMGLPAPSGQTEYANSSKPVRMERFCDSIVINIASADGKGHDQIRQEITGVLEQMLNQYN